MLPHQISTSQADLQQFHQRLKLWYAVHGRHHLPWRQTQDAYAILVSEIMLQQTQVETVLARYYHPFLKKFPSLEALALASLAEVMHAWQGLGYYRRARFLHETARASQPRLPSDADTLMALPGIGKNTAHAIMALAHRKPYAVMEANVRRILSRIYALPAATEKELWELAATLLDGEHPFEYNQAMMDLGAMVCTPLRPQCSICPAQNICRGTAQAEQYPLRKPKVAVPVRRSRILVVRDTVGNIYAAPRTTALLGGLYQFVTLADDAACVQLNEQLIVKEQWQPLGRITQKYSHFTLHAEVFMVTYSGIHDAANWHAPAALPGLAWSNAEQKILKLLEARMGKV